MSRVPTEPFDAAFYNEMDDFVSTLNASLNDLSTDASKQLVARFVERHCGSNAAERRLFVGESIEDAFDPKVGLAYWAYFPHDVEYGKGLIDDEARGFLCQILESLPRFAMHGQRPTLCEDLADLTRRYVEIRGQRGTPHRVRRIAPPRGRPKADPATRRDEEKLAHAWKRAAQVGTYKADFAKDNRLTLKALNALLARVRKRKARADK